MRVMVCSRREKNGCWSGLGRRFLLWVEGSRWVVVVAATVS